MNLRMRSRHCNAKPDEWKQRVRQPVHPGQIADVLALIEMQVQPDIEKFIDAHARYIIYSKTIGFHVFLGYIKIALKWCYPPSEGPIRQQ